MIDSSQNIDKDSNDDECKTSNTFECMHCGKYYKKKKWLLKHEDKCNNPPVVINREREVIPDDISKDDHDYIDFLLFHDNKNDDKNAIISRSIKHIINNFQLFGFSSLTLSLIQTFKEMIENSIDAIKNTKNDKRDIWVNISQCEERDDFVEITVADTGTGMANPLLLLSPFETTKVNGQSDNNFGRFGVGLSTAFVYSFKHTHYPMTVTTKTYDSRVTKKMKLSFDVYTGEIIVSDNVVFVQDEEISGTGIHLVIPIMDTPRPIYHISEFADANDKDTNDKDIMPAEIQKWKTLKEENIYEVIDAISDYLRRLDILSVFGDHCDINIHLTIEVDGINFEREYNSKSELYETNSVISDQYDDTNDDTFQSDATTIRAVKMGGLSMSGLSLYDGAAAEDCNMSVSVSSLLQETLEMSRLDINKKVEMNIDQLFPNFDTTINDVAVATTVDSTPNEAIEVAAIFFDRLATTNIDNRCETIIYKGLKLSLWRYVNDTPLIDLFDDAISCLVSQALTKVAWTEFGHLLKHDVKKMAWSLVPIKESSDIPLNIRENYPSELLLIVNVRSTNVNYANLRKTSLSHDAELISSIVNCISEAMYSLRSTESKDKGYHLFMSKIDRKENAIRKYIPILSQSLAKIIYFSQNPSIHEEFLGTANFLDDETENVETEKKINDQIFKNISARLEDLIYNTYEKSN